MIAVPSRFPTSTVRLKFSSQRGLNKSKGRILRPFLYGLLLILSAPGSADDKRRLTVSLESVNYSEATSIRSLSGEWDDEITSGDNALSYSRVYIGYEQDAFSIQYLQRFEAVFEFDNDTARFIYQIENQLDLKPGEKYKLDIRPKRAASKGIRLGYKNQFRKDINASVFVSLLQPFYILDGDLDGSAEAIASNDYDFEFKSDLVYKEDPLFERGSENISGTGYAVDLFFRYAINDRWQAALDLVDIAGELRIDDAPFTTATASSDIKSFDENGYVVYDPVVRGIEGNKDYTYQFDLQTHLSLGYLLSDRYSITLQHHEYKNFAFQELLIDQSTERGLIRWHLLPELRAAGISYLTTNLMLGISLDDFDYKETKYLALTARYSWAF